MNALIEALNVWADHALRFAWPMLWQSSLLIGLLFALDLLLKRRLRPAVRYVLWLVVLVKLLLPPTLALPTSAGWWLRPAKPAPARTQPFSVVVTYAANELATLPTAAPPTFVAPSQPRLSPLAWVLIGIVTVSLGLLAWLLARWRRVALNARDAVPAPACLSGLPAEVPRHRIPLRLTDREQSPAVCGLFRPVILLPRSLADRLPPAQLRAVLLHELAHLRRGDVWVNCAQALLQVLYWWHPLLWLANARIRRLREEAVDDAVMLALKEDAEVYAPTLLEVARLALHRPLATLGLVGILESRSSLRQRIERLIDFRPPRKAGLTLGSALAVLGFAALAVPMGEAPAPNEVAQSATSPSTATNAAPDGLSNSGASAELQPLYVRTFRVDPDKFIEKLNLPKGPVETNGTSIDSRALLALFAEAGVDLDPTRHPGKVFFCPDCRSPNRGMFLVRGTMQDLEAIERQLANDGLMQQNKEGGSLMRDGKLLYEIGKLNEAEARLKQALKADPHNEAALYYLNLVSEAKHAQSRNETLPVPNPYTRTNLIDTGQGRQSIIHKLDRIRLDSASFDGLPLSEVVRSLSEQARNRDPEKRGINFVINQNVPTDRPHYNKSFPTLGPDGQPLPAPSSKPPDIGNIRVKVNPPLTNVRLADVLDAIVKTADRPIKYSIEDYAIVFSLKMHESTPLYMRTFKVDPNTFLEGLRAETHLAVTNGSSSLTPAIIGFFARAGVDLDPARNFGKNVFFNERQGLLMVRATLQDLDIIEVAMQLLNTVPPQINIRARFVEVPEEDTKALGFDWYLGNVLMSNSPSNTANPQGVFPGNRSAATNDQPLTVGVRHASSPSLGLTGILTEPRYSVVLKALQQREGTELVAQPQVTVLSGRQAQCKVVDARTIVKGIDDRALTPPGVTSTNDTEGLEYRAESMEFGPVLDVTPKVLPDGYTINMTLVASLLEFLGYEDNHTNRVTVYVNGKQKQVTPPRPIVRTAKITSQVNVWDGQTLVLGGLVSERVVTTKDNVPVLGDLPLVGRLFRSESRNSHKRKLLVFITPTIIDPAGNRVHSDDDTPSTRAAIPPQPPR